MLTDRTRHEAHAPLVDELLFMGGHVLHVSQFRERQRMKRKHDEMRAILDRRSGR